MTNLFGWRTRGPVFRYPLETVPRIAVLRADLRAWRPAQVFDPRAADLIVQLGRFQPEALAASYETLLSVGRGLTLRNSVIVFTDSLAQPLLESQRENLWKVFEVPVFEQILAPNGELIATECDAHSGLHLVGRSPGVAQGARERSYTKEPCACGCTGPRLVAADGLHLTASA